MQTSSQGRIRPRAAPGAARQIVGQGQNFCRIIKWASYVPIQTAKSSQFSKLVKISFFQVSLFSVARAMALAGSANRCLLVGNVLRGNIEWIGGRAADSFCPIAIPLTSFSARTNTSISMARSGKEGPMRPTCPRPTYAKGQRPHPWKG